ncbi:type VI secretion system-associated protein TagF [Roseomonas sp. NAR14]|uniref:Type VI secretion system-associated protein TagF n=1 Tax=Roseomonas acroporae TaxID=2937791 RepID=A0A9X1Y7W4_9PROT|nr:type VI secretion system-associated protein TagF [Roseomonas acroporae]MCK8785136.1 type VI secretion system-associated protein TagF [Roseomonas acroporae]
MTAGSGGGGWARLRRLVRPQAPPPAMPASSGPSAPAAMMAGPASGLYGKMPSHGDFVRRGLPRSFVDPWDGCMQAGMLASGAALGGIWAWLWDTAPPWCFLLPAGACGPQPAAGVLLFSRDAGGRRFPLALAATLPPGGDAPAAGWFGALLRLGEAARAGAMDATALAAALPAAPWHDPPGLGAEAPGFGWWRPGGEWSGLGGVLPRPDRFAALLPAPPGPGGEAWTASGGMAVGAPSARPAYPDAPSARPTGPDAPVARPAGPDAPAAGLAGPDAAGAPPSGIEPPVPPLPGLGTPPSPLPGIGASVPLPGLRETPGTERETAAVPGAGVAADGADAPAGDAERGAAILAAIAGRDSPAGTAGPGTESRMPANGTADKGEGG